MNLPAGVHATLEAAATADVYRRTGTIVRISGETVIARGINLRSGELAFAEDPSGRPIALQANGSQAGEAILSMLDRGTITTGARVLATGALASAPTGPAVLGRVIDALGRPLDGGFDLDAARWTPSASEPPQPLTRRPIAGAVATGVRTIDGLLTLGRGQRVGVFAGSGVGKSTLLGMMARGTSADVNVIALVGERGREVRDFLERDLGADALRRSVVVTATGDTPAAMRVTAANAATAIAEGFRDDGRDVLLLFDSLTRVAIAQREIGLAAGEPPAMRGYPPSVFSRLPHLMERAGPGPTGSITAIYTILVDGDDMEDPIADLARATLDGHIVLDRAIANAGQYPPINVLSSVSRLMPRLVDQLHGQAARHVRSLLAAYEDARDLVNIGAYVSGSDAAVDEALQRLPGIRRFMQQGAEEIVPFDETVNDILELAGIEAPAVDLPEPTEFIESEVVNSEFVEVLA
jgi:flagellum-specific ATP synthase